MWDSLPFVVRMAVWGVSLWALVFAVAGALLVVDMLLDRK